MAGGPPVCHVGHQLTQQQSQPQDSTPKRLAQPKGNPTVLIPVENWAPVPGYEDRYEVSDLGRIRSLRRNRKVMARLYDSNGYPVAHLSGGRSTYRQTFAIHRLILLAFVGPKPFEGAVVRHMDGVKANCRLANLRYGTQSENESDKARLGEHPPLASSCSNGHEFSRENTYWRPGADGRGCRTCRREAQQRYVARRAVAA